MREEFLRLPWIYMAKVCLTGQSGFIGKILRNIIEILGHEVVGVYKNSDKKFVLGENLQADEISEFDFLIHCAHDFKVGNADIFNTNFKGSIDIVEFASNQNKPILFISSLAAHSKTESWYGYTKLTLENFINSNGGTSVRVGVLPLDIEGNRFNRLYLGKNVVLCPGDCDTYFYRTDVEDLELVIERFLTSKLIKGKTYRASSSQSVKYRDLYLGKKIFYLNIIIVEKILKIIERVTKRNIGSDSLLSLRTQISPYEFQSLAYVERD